MKPEVTLKYLNYVANKKKNSEEGFTLIELLVVVIIIGVLAAVALPNLLNQVGKARETEIKNAVGTVNRSQQAYHFERQVFATTEGQMGISIPTEYINDMQIASTSGAEAIVRPSNTEAINDGTRAYSGRINFANGAYDQIMCQSEAPAVSLAASDNASTCSAGNIVR
ncbi:MAG: type IV pilin protein [Cyanobacterium sp.]